MFTFKHYRIYLLFLVLSFIFYGSTLKNDFSLDDDVAFTENEKVKKGFAGIPEIFKTRFVEINGVTYDYRPVTLTSFAIEHQLFGINPAISHLINILLYTLCCSVLFLFLKQLFKEYRIEFILLVCLLFLVHPIHSEVVNNIKSRDELLSFLLGFSALYFALIAYDKNKSYFFIIAIFFFLASLLSKLSGIALIAIYPLSIYFFRGKNLKKLVKPSLIMLSSLLLLVIFKRIALGAGQSFRSGEYYENIQYVQDLGFFERIPMAVYCVIFYIGLFLAPFNLISYYGHEQVPASQWGDGIVSFGILVLLGLLFVVWKFHKKYPSLCYGILFYFISISVFSNLLRTAPGVVAERFATIASVGLCITTVFLLFRLFSVNLKNSEQNKSPNKVYITTGLLTIVFFFVVVNRNSDWYDKETLIATDVEKAPKSVKLHTLYGSILMTKLKPGNSLSYQEKIQTFKLAMSHLEEAIRLYPKHSIAWNNLGTLYLKSNQAKKARKAYLNAIKFNPEYRMAYSNLGDFYASYNQQDSASYYYTIANNLGEKEKKDRILKKRR